MKALALSMLVTIVASCAQKPGKLSEHHQKSLAAEASQTDTYDADHSEASSDNDHANSEQSGEQNSGDLATPGVPDNMGAVTEKDRQEPKEEAPKAYDPCPEKGQECVIMPLGDSITHGLFGYDYGGYRVPLIRRSWAEKRSITFVGDKSSGPEKVDGRAFPKANEGHPGWTIADIQIPDEGEIRSGITKVMSATLKKNKPHIILMMIGTNDIATNSDLPNAPKRLANLLDVIIKEAPNTLLLVAQITPSTTDTWEQRILAYNAAIPALVKERADAGAHIGLVDLHSAIVNHPKWKTKELFSEHVHPNEAGFDIMADTWWDAMQKYLK